MIKIIPSKNKPRRFYEFRFTPLHSRVGKTGNICLRPLFSRGEWTRGAAQRNLTTGEDKWQVLRCWRPNNNCRILHLCQICERARAAVAHKSQRERRRGLRKMKFTVKRDDANLARRHFSQQIITVAAAAPRRGARERERAGGGGKNPPSLFHD